MAANTTYLAPGEGETVFSVSASPIKFGVGALRELGADAQSLGMKRVALFVDPHVLASGGEKTWTRGMGTAACELTCRYLRQDTSTTSVLDPFCGCGTAIAVAERLKVTNCTPLSCRMAP
mgnify:CR=1 FL=1